MAGPPRTSSPTLPGLGGIPRPGSPAGPRSPGSPPPPAIDFGVRLTEPGIQPVASETARAWAGTTVTFHLDRSTDEKAKPGPDGRASVSHDQSLRREEIPFDVEASREGPHTPPVVWRLSGGPASGRLTRKDPTANVAVSTRLRLSAWTTGESLWDTNTLLVDRKKYADIQGVDDITLTQTVRLKDIADDAKDEDKKKADDDVDWASNFLHDAADFGDPAKNKKRSAEQREKELRAKRAAFLGDCLSFFHGKSIQVFVGFEIVTEKAGPNTDKAQGKIFEENARAGTRFVKWLTAKKEDVKDFEAHAKKLVAFFDDLKLDIDGISYDLEVDGLKESHKERMRCLFLAVAAELRKKGRYLAYATAAFLPGVSGNFMLEQPFSHAGAGPDIIARAMSYDIGKRREEMYKFAITTQKLHPAQFQVGLGTRLTNNPISHAEFDEECKRLWQPYRAGVIHWAMQTGDDAKQLASHNGNLNPKNVLTAQLGQPLQGPLNKLRLAAFQAAKAGSAPKTASDGSGGDSTDSGARS